MSRKVLMCVFVAACLCIAGISVADNGPADMVLQAEKDKAISEDQRDDAKEEVQELTKRYEASASDLAKDREKEVMDV